MAVMNINPTRMEMNNLKDRLDIAKRGHKLLEDKQDELVRRFLEIIRKNKDLRVQVEEALTESFQDFTMASAYTNPSFLDLALSMPTQRIQVDIETENIMSVEIPIMEFKKTQLVDQEDEDSNLPYGYYQTNPELDKAINKMEEVLDMMLELAEIEKTTQLMADEIEVTRRRVNALEYKTIPDLEDTIRFIRMKLEESERETITRLMKTKDLIDKDARHY